MRRVAVLTTFVHLQQAYSLCSVVETQLRMLLRHGYETTFVGCEGFRPEGVYCDPDLKRWLMPAHLVDATAPPTAESADFWRGVDRIVASLRPLLGQVDVVLTHDFAYLPGYLAYNHACRRLAEEFPAVTWLHFVHSAPWPNAGLPDEDPQSARFRPFPHAYLVYPNGHDVARLAAQFGTDEGGIKVVPHAMDFERDLDLHPLTRALVGAYDLYSPDILSVYPVRMDRGKQPEKLVRLFAALKLCGATVRLVVVNFHSMRPAYREYRDEVAREAAELGLTRSEVVFTNAIPALPGISPKLLDAYRFEFPRRVVLDLFRLSNVYVHPSVSESYSLVCQEAASCGNLLVLNSQVPAMREVYGPAAYYMTFTSDRQSSVTRAVEMAQYVEDAGAILQVMRDSATTQQKTRLRQTRNPDVVFRDWLEPLLHLQPRR